LDDLPRDPDEFAELIGRYKVRLEENFFLSHGMVLRNGLPFSLFYNARHEVMVMFGVEEVNGRECFTIIMS
jgi:hypothetical protein